MKSIIVKHWLILLGVFIGALGGYMYWRIIGCSTESCPITSSPINSTLWGALMGGLLFSIFKGEKKNDAL